MRREGACQNINQSVNTSVDFSGEKFGFQDIMKAFDQHVSVRKSIHGIAHSERISPLNSTYQNVPEEIDLIEVTWSVINPN